MEPLMSNASLIRRLKKGLRSPNPSNPDRKMWTLEDLDKPSPGFQYNVDIANSSLQSFPRGYAGVRHRNLARENEIKEQVEIIDPRDLP
tara:strand:+ start:502 stop:768 length:267 start_codon:yes stop_codon:yes gene_type:complete